MKHQLVFTMILGVAAAACGGSKPGDQASKPAEAPAKGASGETPALAQPTGNAPIEISIHKIERLTQVAPNETYAAKGLGAKAEADHTFVCLQFQAKNISTDELFLPPAQLVIAGDVFETSKQAAGKYLPSDWQKEAYGKLAVGATSKETACFEVPLAKAAGAVTLRFEKTRWGKNSGWVAQADGQYRSTRRLPSPANLPPRDLAT